MWDKLNISNAHYFIDTYKQSCIWLPNALFNLDLIVEHVTIQPWWVILNTPCTAYTFHLVNGHLYLVITSVYCSESEWCAKIVFQFELNTPELKKGINPGLAIWSCVAYKVQTHDILFFSFYNITTIVVRGKQELFTFVNHPPGDTTKNRRHDNSHL